MQSMQEVLRSYLDELTVIIDHEIKGRAPSPQEQRAKDSLVVFRRNISTLLDKYKKDDNSKQAEDEYVDLFKKTQAGMNKLTETTYELISREVTSSGIFSTNTLEKRSEKISPLASIANRIMGDMEHRFNVFIMTAEFRKREAELKAVSDDYGTTNQKVLAEIQQNQSIQEAQLASALRMLTTALKSMPDSAKESLLKEVKVETSADGAIKNIKITSEQPQKFDNGNFDNRYASNLVPVEDAVKKKPLAGALSCFSYAMSPRRAAVAAILFRYFIKMSEIAGECPSKHPFDYTQERATVNKNNINMKGYISACIFYLFLEVDKGWDEIMKDSHNPAGRLMVVAKQNRLSKIQSKLERITEANNTKDTKMVVASQSSKPKLVLDTLSDVLEVREAGKTKFSFTGKYAGMFFMANPTFATNKYDLYLEKLYRRGASADQLASKHDDEILHKLYQVK